MTGKLDEIPSQPRLNISPHTYRESHSMASSIGRVTEITSKSDKSFEHAVAAGVKRASKTLDNITGAWVQDMKVDVEDGKITAYRVNLKLTFILKD